MSEHTLFIDSRNAHIVKSNVEFSILLNSAESCPGVLFKNVTSVELVGISIKNDGLTSEPYVILDIEELNNRIHSNVPTANRTFGVLYLDNTSTHTQYIKGQDFDAKVRTFNPPLDSLSRLTVRLLSGNPSSPLDASYDGYLTMIFKIKTIM